ncbi:CNNM domain-containing protein [Dongshaea marina]|uniref:CNNM domain-containing protein n=1 Tax=Dongshaea marina TaxID=2047966 RepID=UPI000D3ECFA5|nr:hemolysin family protein [Dongshaea marina]
MLLLLIYLLLAILFSFICSVLEAVLLSVTPSYIQLQQQSHPKVAGRLARLKASIDQPLAAILTLNTIAHTAGAAGVGAQVAFLYGDSYLAVSSAIMTILVLVLSEIIPKTLGVTYWRKLAPFASWLLPLMIKALYPFVWMSDRIIARIAKEEDLSNFRAEIAAMAELGQQQGVLKAEESQVLCNLLHLETIRATRVMTPRAVVHRLEQSQTVEQYLVHMERPFSRIPLYEGDPDNIIGYVRKQDLMYAALKGEVAQPLANYQRELLMLPDSVSVLHAYKRLLAANDLIAAVVNEYGEVQGIITMEDLIETLLGKEIVDETDTHKDMQRLARSRWLRHLRNKKHTYSQ